MTENEPVVYKLCPECLTINRRPLHQMYEDHHDGLITQKAIDEFKESSEMSSMFPSRVRTWHRHCPTHVEKGIKRDVFTITNSRFIPVDWFDVYDEDGYHVCRACGGDLINKKGIHHGARRWCNRDDEEHKKWVSETLYTWATVRDHYATTLAEKQVPLITEKFQAEIDNHHLRLFDDGDGLKIYKWFYIFESMYPECSYASSVFSSSRAGYTVIMCEKCGQLATLDQHYHSGGKLPEAQVHHKIAVSQVNETNVLTIFDENNLECLCLACHGKSHPWRKREQGKEKPAKKYKGLEAFIEK